MLCHLEAPGIFPKPVKKNGFECWPNPSKCFSLRFWEVKVPDKPIGPNPVKFILFWFQSKLKN